MGRKRVLRLMRAHHLLAPSRPRHEHGDPAHAGTIITTRPDEMWGTDATRFYTEREGWCWFLRRGRSLHDRGGGLARGEDRRSLGGARADPARDDDGLRHDRPEGRPRGGAPPRLGQSVHGEHLRQRDQVLRLHGHAGVRRRAGVQRVRGAVHADAQGAVSLPAPVSATWRRRAGSSARSSRSTTASGSSSAWGTGRLPRHVAMRCRRPREEVPDYRPGRVAWLYGALRASRFGRSGRLVVKRLSCPRNRARYTAVHPSFQDRRLGARNPSGSRSSRERPSPFVKSTRWPPCKSFSGRKF